jgi:hypothetical protein
VYESLYNGHFSCAEVPMARPGDLGSINIRILRYSHNIAPRMSVQLPQEMTDSIIDPFPRLGASNSRACLLVAWLWTFSSPPPVPSNHSSLSLEPLSPNHQPIGTELWDHSRWTITSHHTPHAAHRP